MQHILKNSHYTLHTTDCEMGINATNWYCIEMFIYYTQSIEFSFNTHIPYSYRVVFGIESQPRVFRCRSSIFAINFVSGD